MKIRTTLLSLSFVFSVGACGGNDGDKFGAIADEVCACKDMKCVDQAEEKWDKLEKEMRDKYKDKKPDESVVKAYKAAEEKAEKCADALKGKGE